MRNLILGVLGIIAIAGLIIMGSFSHAVACDNRIIVCCCGEFSDWCAYCQGNVCDIGFCFSTAWCICYDTGSIDEEDCPQYG